MSYTHLSQDQRHQIQHLHGGGFSAREIGVQLERAAATISRELRRGRYTRLSDPGAHAFAGFQCISIRIVLNQHDELLSTISNRTIDDPDRRAEALPHKLDDLVTEGVSERVIDSFEPINIGSLSIPLVDFRLT